MFGLETEHTKVLPNGIKADALVNTDSNSTSQGAGTVRRSEQLVTNVAAIVTQVLPNGNLVIEGKQEIRVNFEVRELIVAGVVRPEDIEADNTIDFDQDRPGPHRLWRPRPDHRRAAAALRPAGHGRAAALLDGPVPRQVRHAPQVTPALPPRPRSPAGAAFLRAAKPV